MTSSSFPSFAPELQIAFHGRLRAIESSQLQGALRAAVRRLDIARIDQELSAFVGAQSLSKLASLGLRGELIFPVPLLLREAPSLLGYYRLLYGLSQKEFYRGGAFGRFKPMELRSVISTRVAPELAELCASLISTGEQLVAAIDELSIQTIRDLQLLTFGSQLRGGRNPAIGQSATAEMFSIVRALVHQYVQDETTRSLVLNNESGRRVEITFSNDPDITITEQLPTGPRLLLAVEIKGGTDVSNIHNRIGEAEKSHQNARADGYNEFWTILGVQIDTSRARQQSPTTTRFFYIPQLRDSGSEAYGEFRDNLQSLIGIRIQATS